MTNILFVCSYGRDRSATAAAMYHGINDLKTDHGGVHPQAKRPVTAAMIDAADLIVCFEEHHRKGLERLVSKVKLVGKRSVVLSIANRYGRGSMTLQLLISARMRQRVRELGEPTVRILSQPRETP